MIDPGSFFIGLYLGGLLLGGVASLDSRNPAIFILSTLFWPIVLLIFVSDQLSKKNDE